MSSRGGPGPCLAPLASARPYMIDFIFLVHSCHVKYEPLSMQIYISFLINDILFYQKSPTSLPIAKLNTITNDVTNVYTNQLLCNPTHPKMSYKDL